VLTEVTAHPIGGHSAGFPPDEDSQFRRAQREPLTVSIWNAPQTSPTRVSGDVLKRLRYRHISQVGLQVCLHFEWRRGAVGHRTCRYMCAIKWKFSFRRPDSPMVRVAGVHLVDVDSRHTPNVSGGPAVAGAVTKPSRSAFEMASTYTLFQATLDSCGPTNAGPRLVDRLERIPTKVNGGERSPCGPRRRARQIVRGDDPPMNPGCEPGESG
jgi:hypothetical protein